jgi:malonyl-CoA/methylmalonyl-CoA synthetase
MNIAARMIEILRAEPDAHALTVIDSRGRVVDDLTRGALLASVAAWHAHLRDKGARPGSRVALAPPRDRSLPALHIAALACGAAVVPINTALSPRERSEVLAAASPDVVIDEAAIAAAAQTIASQAGKRATGRIDAVRSGDALALDAAPRASGDPALLIFTSGTTGKPKSVPLTHRNLTTDLDALNEMWRRSASDRLLHVLPAHHLHGLGLALYGSLLVGGEIVLAPAFDPRLVLDVVRHLSINVVMGVPTMYARLIATARPDDSLSGLRLALCGSAPLGLRQWEAFRKRFGITLIERYGLTEVGIITSNPIDAPVGGSVGVPIPGATVVVHADEGYFPPTPGRASPRGEVCIAGPTVMPGYGNDPEANAKSFVDGYFRSGDLGYFDERGYLWIDGRLKDLIIVGGSNVVPAEVERALEGIGEILECAAVGVPDADLGEIVGVFVVPSDAALTKDRVERAVSDAAAAQLARYKRPRRVFVVSELPRNTMGKIDRARLRASLAS